MLKVISSLVPGRLLAAWLLAVPAAAQTALDVYTDRLNNGFQDWSWASRDFNNSSPVQSGNRSIEVQAEAWEAISFHHAAFNAAAYADLVFWAHGGSSGGQRLQVVAEFGDTNGAAHALPALAAGTWREFVVPLSALGAADASDLHRLTIQLTASGGSGVFYLDDVRLVAQPPPALVRVEVDATRPLRTVDTRWFGVNTAIWDSHFEHPETASLLSEMGITTLRFPGGSLSDEYHWATGTTLNNTWRWVTSFADFIEVATNVGAEVFITVNYGTGTPEEAAAWVRHANITNRLGIRCWEIGNENYGTWETDHNNLPHHAHTYALRAKKYIEQMKAADPTIKVGVVVVPGEGSYDNGYTDHPARNPRTGETHYGWTPVLLTSLRALGMRPDFAVHHHYPQWTDPSNPSASPDSDALLLQSASNWARDAADLRRQIQDYFGPAGTNIELVVTENNSDAGAQGRQSTSLVNGLYYADSLCQLMRTEFNSFVWWDLRNGTDRNGGFDSGLYGWRDYGDLGMINGRNTRHPTFYAAGLLRHFARGGDTVLSTTSDYLWLSAYAARRTNGAVTLLVLNKSTVANLQADVRLHGFAPQAATGIRSFGIPQDEAARTNGPAADRDIALTSFSSAATNFFYDVPPLSLTLFALSPESPRLAALPRATEGELVVELHGQPHIPYVIQGSSNLVHWEPVSTHTLTGSMVTLTNLVPDDASRQFWRAVWQP